MKNYLNRSKQLLILLLFSQICWTSPIKEKEQKSEKEIWVTVFIHGIISPKQNLSFFSIIRFFKDNIGDSEYARTVKQIRKDPFFYQYHAMREYGLRKVDTNVIQKGKASTAHARAYDQISSFNGPKNRENYYYTFGWSALLSPKKRYEEAKILYAELQKEIPLFTQNGTRPKLRIIGYSHGGNLALHLGTIGKNVKDIALEVDELVLLGVPVIKDTDHLIYSPCFKKIYHFYSYGDRVQKLDLFSSNGSFFSHRTFHEQKNVRLPDKLVQINLRIKRPTSTTRRCIKKKCGCKKMFNKQIYPYSALKNVDPGHSELWSFGWTPTNYRSYFPLNPLPTAVFLTYISQAIQTDARFKNHVIVDLRPFNETIIIKNKDNRFEKHMRFLTHHQMHIVKQDAYNFKPDNFTSALYEAKICHALNTAREHKKEEWERFRISQCRNCGREHIRRTPRMR